MIKQTILLLDLPLKRITILAAGCLCAVLVQAQEATNASGGNATGSGGTVAYSVGQTFIQTLTGSSGSLSEGVQQVYEIGLVTALDEEEVETFVLTVFPNPTADHVNLQLADTPRNKMIFQLYDIKGQLLEQQSITEVLTQIPLTSMPSGAYILKVLHQNKTLQTFKLIKKR